jgi:hypothetical protein
VSERDGEVRCCAHGRVAVGRRFMGYERTDPTKRLRPATEVVCLECGALFSAFDAEDAVPGGWSADTPRAGGDTVYKRNML